MRRKRSDDPPIELRDHAIPWNPGEHVAVIGRTGTGKTTLMKSLVSYRNYVAMLRTKSDDVRFNDLVKIKDTRQMRGVYGHRFLVYPPFESQASVGASMMVEAWRQGGWTVFLDELFYIHKNLGLHPYVDMLLTQGRSKRITVVAGMQRPVQVTRFALTEVQHVFSFVVERREQELLSEAVSEKFASVLDDLPRFHFAHYHVPTRTIAIGTAQTIGAILTPPKRLASTTTGAKDDG